jgi:hypothetical protein
MENTMNTKTNTSNPCSCGCTEAHVIARRKTFDGIAVQLWSDGAVTCGINTYVAMAPRSAHGRRNAVKAAWLMAGEVALYDHAELRGLVLAARKAVEQPTLQPETYLRAVMRGAKFVRSGAVIRHASACPCPECTEWRAAALKRPAAERLYRSIPLANGMIASVRIACLALLALGLGGACRATVAPAAPVETVGTLAAGPSVYSAPLKHDAPPELGGIADTGDDIPETGPSASDILRAEREKAGAVEGTDKGGGLVTGSVR